MYDAVYPAVLVRLYAYATVGSSVASRMHVLQPLVHWALAARMVFAISPNSASCERVFSLLKLMFGNEQMSTLADAICAALMLRYNDRMVG